MTLDRTQLHWYVPDTSKASSDLAALQAQNGSISERLNQLASKLATPQSQSASATDMQIARLSNAVAILSLVQSYGGFQTTTSAAGKACVNYLYSGQGSITDCGFQHVSP